MMRNEPELRTDDTALTTALRALAHDVPAVPAFHAGVMARAHQQPLVAQLPAEDDPRLVAALQALAHDAPAAPAFHQQVMARAHQHRWSAVQDRGSRLSACLCAVRHWLRQTFTMQAVIPAAVAVGLVLACLWPRLWEVEQEVHTLQGQLQDAHQQQQIAFQRAHAVQEQLLAHVELVAYQSFDGGKYAEAASRYVENSQWEPARAGEYAIKAATAAWYGCHYEDALHLLASRRGDPGDPTLQQFVLGTVYHSLGRWDAAQQQYEQVIAAGPSARLEAAWFNLGVVQAVRFRQTHDAAALQSAMAAVQQSAAIAEQTSRQQYHTRVEKIAHALEPIAQRPPHACGEGYHTTQDLTALREVSSFTEWLHAQQRALERST
jgi:tetratricopeptide (TPR) repeat protein